MNSFKSLKNLEKDAICAALKEFQGNISVVAKALGVSRATLYRKIERHKVDFSTYRSGGSKA